MELRAQISTFNICDESSPPFLQTRITSVLNVKVQLGKHKITCSLTHDDVLLAPLRG